MKCEFCDSNESIPFRCNYCNKLFCHTHRIPINHSCVSMKDYIDKKNMMNYNSKNSILINLILRIKFSKLEIRDLTIATILVIAVGLSFNGYRHISWQFLAIFVSAFLVHVWLEIWPILEIAIFFRHTIHSKRDYTDSIIRLYRFNTKITV